MLLVFFACASGNHLSTGVWQGTMTPMNHPDMITNLQFDISQESEGTRIEIWGPGGMIIPTQDVSVNRGHLSFTFLEPEQNVQLTCNFTGDNQSGFEGRCEDAEGKWAQFSLTPPGR